MELSHSGWCLCLQRSKSSSYQSVKRQSPCSAGTHQEIPNKALAQRSSESPPAPRAAGTIPPTRLGWELQAANRRSSPCSGCGASARAGDGSELSWEGFPQALRPPWLQPPAPAAAFTLAPRRPSLPPSDIPQHPDPSGGAQQHPCSLSLRLQCLLLSPQPLPCPRGLGQACPSSLSPRHPEASSPGSRKVTCLGVSHYSEVLFIFFAQICGWVGFSLI